MRVETKNTLAIVAAALTAVAMILTSATLLPSPHNTAPDEGDLFIVLPADEQAEPDSGSAGDVGRGSIPDPPLTAEPADAPALPSTTDEATPTEAAGGTCQGGSCEAAGSEQGRGRVFLRRWRR